MSRHIRLALVLFIVVALAGAFIGPAGSAAEPGPTGGQLSTGPLAKWQ